jgi:hypothetical protein
MSDADLQGLVAHADLESSAAIQPSDLCEPHGEHEAESIEHVFDMSDNNASADCDGTNMADTRSETNANIRPSTEPGEETASEMSDTKNLVSPTKPKAGLSVKPPQAKTPSAPSTPTVKKVP